MLWCATQPPFTFQDRKTEGFTPSAAGVLEVASALPGPSEDYLWLKGGNLLPVTGPPHNMGGHPLPTNGTTLRAIPLQLCGGSDETFPSHH